MSKTSRHPQGSKLCHLSYHNRKYIYISGYSLGFFDVVWWWSVPLFLANPVTIMSWNFRWLLNGEFTTSGSFCVLAVELVSPYFSIKTTLAALLVGIPAWCIVSPHSSRTGEWSTGLPPSFWLPGLCWLFSLEPPLFSLPVHVQPSNMSPSIPELFCSHSKMVATKSVSRWNGSKYYLFTGTNWTKSSVSETD